MLGMTGTWSMDYVSCRWAELCAPRNSEIFWRIVRGQICQHEKKESGVAAGRRPKLTYQFSVRPEFCRYSHESHQSVLWGLGMLCRAESGRVSDLIRFVFAWRHETHETLTAQCQLRTYASQKSKRSLSTTISTIFIRLCSKTFWTSRAAIPRTSLHM